MNIGDRLKKLRNDKNLTQKELASILYVSDKAVSSWEANRTEPSLELLVKLSEFFCCSTNYLIYGETNRVAIETEIKIKLSEEEFKNLELLMKKSANFLAENHHTDTYYQPIARKFINDGEIKEWLRIGERGNKNIINYKNWYDDYCDEYEVEFDDVNNLIKIFNRIGLEKIAIVDKVRSTYFYLDKYEVALDRVKNLGYFVEIEVKKYDDTAEKEYDELLRLAKRLNLNLDNQNKKGYPYYFLDNEKRN